MRVRCMFKSVNSFPRTVTALAATAALSVLPPAPAQALPAKTLVPAAQVLPASVKAQPHTKKAAVASFKKWVKQWNKSQWDAQYETLVSQQQKSYDGFWSAEWRSRWSRQATLKATSRS